MNTDNKTAMQLLIEWAKNHNEEMFRPNKGGGIHFLIPTEVIAKATELKETVEREQLIEFYKADNTAYWPKEQRNDKAITHYETTYGTSTT